MPKQKPLPIIWRTPDEPWEIIEPILKEHDPPKNTGRPRIDQREALDAIIFRMRSGCQWNRLPRCYDNAPARETVQERSYIPHMRRIGEENSMLRASNAIRRGDGW